MLPTKVMLGEIEDTGWGLKNSRSTPDGMMKVCLGKKGFDNSRWVLET
jgi:hypothetical protein